MSSIEEVLAQPQRLLGQVKWFNNKAGYGFITVTDGEHTNKDIFIHFSSINVTDSQYRYLIQGEYVEFSLEKSTTEKHELQGTNISGIKGGKLMCETRNVKRRLQDGEQETEPTYRRYRVSSRSESTEQGEGDFTQVRRRRQVKSFPRKRIVNEEHTGVVA
jgi:cold shock CspA family protein